VLLSFDDMPRRTKEKLRSGELTVLGDQWPLFLYARHEYDPEDPWKGLLRGSILVSVSCLHHLGSNDVLIISGLQACLHVA
jgi:hypothetical protein